ncbi:MAG: 16S rRNA (uracil(1498)-N(3))-methyltransferase, partial [Chitinophagales bacterium]|nr:16S rRNA (uracil(1498)-N(3))-methyltransferase [Chitinophagales bacterium]
MQLFYAPDILQNKFVLNEEESKHCIQVLRHRQDDEINLTDGKGGLYTARITDANVRKCTYTI